MSATVRVSAVPEQLAAALLLTCCTCERTREHVPGEPLRAECPDLDCAGWTVTVALVEPGGVR